MSTYKAEILDNICYTDLVYKRINKKLQLELSKDNHKAISPTILNGIT